MKWVGRYENGKNLAAGHADGGDVAQLAERRTGTAVTQV